MLFIEHTHTKSRPSIQEKTLMLVKIEGKRRRGGQRIRWLDSITASMNMNFSKLQAVGRTGKPDMLQSMGSQRIRHD